MDGYFQSTNKGIDTIELKGADKELNRANIDLLVSYMAGHGSYDLAGHTGNGKTVRDRINELWVTSNV